jgi:hypothetical protein
MLKQKIDYVTQDIELTAGNSGVQSFDANFDRDFTHVVGIAIFTEEQPDAVKDYQISFGTRQHEFLPMVTHKMLESKDQAPDDKMLTVQLPCDHTIQNILKVLPSIEIPTNTKLKFQVVYKVVNANDGSILNFD